MYSIIDSEGGQVAKVTITAIEDGWYYGTLVQQNFTEEMTKALEWYDEVVTNQMLSFLDEALMVVEKFQLRVCLSEARTEPIYSLHLSKDGAVTFRISLIV